MTYQQFIESIALEINETLPESIHAQIHSSLKNNNISRLGITISDSNVNISPTIYMEEFYQEYQQGLSISEISSIVLDIYDEIRFDQSWELEEIREFSSIKHRIVYKLIHKKENSLLLAEVPYIPYHDLAIVFYILLEIESSGSGTILITNSMLQTWDISVHDLYLAASENAATLLPPKFNTMHSVLCEMLGTDCVDGDFADNHMYILTNSMSQFGAATILYKDLLEQIALELQDDFYILPCSVHEVIILPRSYSPCPEDIDRMIVEINETQIAPDEVLSDHSYYYSKLHKSLFLTH